MVCGFKRVQASMSKKSSTCFNQRSAFQRMWFFKSVSFTIGIIFGQITECLQDNQLKAEELLLFGKPTYLAVQHDHYDQPSMADEVINGFAAGDGYHPSIAVPLINHLVSASKKDM